ncbi:MAG: 4Fe-4S binding protein, partial [Oscillospiraceae bacterium]
QKLASTEDISALSKLKVNGNENYIEYKGVPFKPLTTDACEGCGLCAEKCPVGAIPKDHPNQTQTEICISCMRCIEICPNKARHLDAAMLAHVEKSFREKCGNRKEAEFFI